MPRSRQHPRLPADNDLTTDNGPIDRHSPRRSALPGRRQAAGPVHPGTWAPPDEITLETAVRQYLDPGDPSSVYLGIVHRLDRPTSGVLIWAKTPKAARRLSSQFERRRVVKEYWAIVESRPENAAGRRQPADETWTDWLTHADANGRRQRRAYRTRRVRARRSPRFVSRRPDLSHPDSPGCGSGRRPAGPTNCGSRPPCGECRSWAIRLMDRPSPPRCREGSRFTHASLRSIIPSPAAEMTLVAPLPSTWAEAGSLLPDSGDPGYDRRHDLERPDR